MEFASAVALEAGKLLKKLSRGKPEITYKGPVDLVTKADLLAEKFIIEKIKANFPDHKILTEEGGLQAGSQKSDFLWLIDPLDGTTNYAHNFPVYAVSIGLQFQEEIIVGVVYDPNLDELFTAEKGKGSFLNGKPIRVSEIKELDKSLLATGFPYSLRENPDKIVEYFAVFSFKAQGIRRPGAASIDLCSLACGRVDGFWEVGLKPWDTAAGSLIIIEAGGYLSRFDGSSFDIWIPEVLATNGLIHKQMLEVFAQIL